MTGAVVAADRAAEVVTPAYDALTATAREDERARSAWTFLHALPTRSRAGEVTGEVLDACADAVDRLRREAFEPVAAPFVAVYRLREGRHVQTGLVADLDVQALGTVVRGHEHTRRDREDDLVRYLDRVGVQSSPVCLAAPDDDVFRRALDDVTARPPDVDVTAADLVQDLWVVDDPAAVTRLLDATTGIAEAVITDGHHRAAAARRHAESVPGSAVAGRVLVALFAASDLQVGGFHRVVGPPLPIALDDLPDTLRDHDLVAEPARPDAAPTAGTVVATAAGAWWRLPLRDDGPTRPDVRRLQDQVLDPVLGVADPREDVRLSYVPATLPRAALLDAVGADGVGFATVAPDVEDLLASARDGRPLPPKSTYVHPKARSGLLLVPRR